MKVIAFCFFCLLAVTPNGAWSQCSQNKEIPQLMDCAKEGPAVNSGKGSDWSNFYEISADAPSGYVLWAHEFYLNGPHPCTSRYEGGMTNNFLFSAGGAVSQRTGTGSWAECETVKQTETSVTWKYRLQGWTETHFLINGNGVGWETVPVKITEKAILRTVWIKKADADKLKTLDKTK